MASIHWDISPEILRIFGLPLRWYGLFFLFAFLFGFLLVQKIFRKEGKPEKDLDPLLYYMMGGTLIGARLGHCIFYDPAFYFGNPIEILKVWEGGLASHGGVAGILIALYLYCRKRPDQPYLWLLDRMTIPALLGSFFIRMGNLFNSEIVGIETDVPWAFVFVSHDLLPRHPAQLYEALTYLCLFLFFLQLYKRTVFQNTRGLMLGVFLICVFSARFLIEFVKTRQEAFSMGIPISMGQLLSLPLIVVGIVLLVRGVKKRSSTAEES